MASVPKKTIEIFFSYAPKDQRLRDQLETRAEPYETQRINFSLARS